MRTPIALLLLLMLGCWSCQPDHGPDTKGSTQNKPPPPPPDINELPDAIDRVEEARFYSAFALARSGGTKAEGKTEPRCGYKFNSFFYDEDRLAAVPAVDTLLFEFSNFSNPLRLEKGRLVDYMIDDESQETILFQLPHQRRFRYVDQELRQLKLCAVNSASGVLDTGDANMFIQNGVLEGRRLNDSVVDVRLEARYRMVMKDTSYWMPVRINALFKRRPGPDKPWEYQCPLFKKSR